MQSSAVQTSPAAAAGGATRFIPLVKWPEFHAYPSLGGLRWLAFTNRDRFRDECVRQVGRRVLIDEAAFFAWIARQGRGSR
jgi:hypothetical protein